MKTRVCYFAVFVLALFLGGCALTRQGEEKVFGAGFVVGGFPGPPAGEITSARYEEIKEAGIDVIVPYWGTMDGEKFPEMLDLAWGAGVKVLVMDTRMWGIVKSIDVPYDGQVVADIVADYKDHPAVIGYGIRDEPGAKLFERLGEIRRTIDRLDGEHPGFCNLFPGYASTAQLEAEDFREYVRKYVEVVGPAVLMYDHYPLKVNRKETGWHEDLRLFRQESRRAQIPLWMFMQCEGAGGFLRVPTREEIFWQASTALAYGVRGVWWYRYWGQPVADRKPNEPDRHPGAMIDGKGNRSDSYYYVQQANEFLHKAGDALTGWDNRYVGQIAGDNVKGDCPFVTLKGGDLQVVAGTFVRGDGIRIVLANDSYEKNAEYRIRAQSGLQVKKVIAKLSAEVPQDPKDEKAVWKLGPGGGLIVEIK